MPPFETMDLHQYAVLWESRTPDSYGANSYGPAAEIRVRWVKGRSRTGRETSSSESGDVTVVVAQDVPIGSVLYEGDLETAFNGTAGTADGDLIATADLFEVIGSRTTTSIHNKYTRRTLTLKRFGGRLPN